MSLRCEREVTRSALPAFLSLGKQYRITVATEKSEGAVNLQRATRKKRLSLEKHASDLGSLLHSSQIGYKLSDFILTWLKSGTYEKWGSGSLPYSNVLTKL